MPLIPKRYWIIAIGLLLFIPVSAVGIHQTQQTRFCLSCHEMQIYQTELDASPHARDADGNKISCTQCHVPGSNVVRMLAAKSYLGIKDMWVHYVEEEHELDRAAMQPMARRFVDDSNCRACHEDLTKNAKGKETISEEGLLAHEAYLGKNGQARNGCAGCHCNMAHLPPFNERIPSNAVFLSKLKESQ